MAVAVGDDESDKGAASHPHPPPPAEASAASTGALADDDKDDAGNVVESESTPILKSRRNAGAGLRRRLENLRSKWNTFSSSSSSTVASSGVATSTTTTSTTTSTDATSSASRWFSTAVKRRCCFVLIGIYLFLDGLEGGFIIPTLWLLLENRFHLKSEGYFLG